MRKSLRKMIMCVSVCMVLMGGMGLTSLAAYGVLTVSHSGKTCTASLSNVTDKERRGEVWISQTNDAQDSDVGHYGWKYAKLLPYRYVSTSYTVSKKYAWGHCYLFDTTSIDSRIVYQKCEQIIE